MRLRVKIIILFLAAVLFGAVFFACNYQEPELPIPNTYTINYVAETGGEITGDKNQVIAEGGVGNTVTAVADDAYIFVKWSDGKTNPARYESNIDSDLTITAIFEIKYIAIVYSADAGGQIDGEKTQSIKYGDDSRAVTAVPNEGYQFVTWSDGNTNRTRTDENITTPNAFTAIFEIKYIAIVYSADTGGQIDGEKTQSIKYGDNSRAVTAVANEGYQFVTWSDGNTNRTRTDENITTPNAFTAIFEVKTYTVKYQAEQGGVIIGEKVQTIAHGKDADEVAIELMTGYMFVEWSDGNGFSERIDRNITSDMTVTARFEFLFGGGDGSVDNPLLIDSYEQLMMMNIFPDSNYKLNTDLDLRGINHLPPFHLNYMFNGSFDGDGHTISNLTVDRYIALPSLFGSIGEDGIVKNLSIKNFNIAAPNYNTAQTIDGNSVIVPLYVGAVAGISYGTLSNISVDGIITAKTLDYNFITIGGIVGEAHKEIVNCHSLDVTINLSNVNSGNGQHVFNVGGLVGRAIINELRDCSASGAINIEYTKSTSGRNIGGLAGVVFGSEDTAARVQNCNSDMDIIFNFDSNCGGLIGYTDSASTFLINNCHASGDIYANDSTDIAYCGGLVGRVNCVSDLIITDCYASGDVTLSNGSAGGFGAYFYTNGGYMNNCYASGNVNTESFAGGFLDHISNRSEILFEIRYCYASGNVRGASVGGFVSDASNVNFYRSYSSGNINASVYAGVFARSIKADYVAECFSTGEITGNAPFISGFIFSSVGIKLIKNCYSISDINASGNGIYTGLTYMVASSTEINNCYYGGKITASREAGGIASFYHAGAKIINCHFIIHEGGAADTAFRGDYSLDGFSIYAHDIFDTDCLIDQLNSELESMWIAIDNNLPQLSFIII